MKLEEILKSKGLSDEDATFVIDEMNRNKIFTASEENLDIRYKDLQTKYKSKDKENQQATELIEQLKKDNAVNAKLKSKITEYETKMTALQSELEQTKVESTLKVALLESKALDVDYLIYKIKGKGEISIGHDGKIKDIDKTISAMKIQYPSQFFRDSKRRTEENGLPAVMIRTLGRQKRCPVEILRCKNQNSHKQFEIHR